MPEFARQLRQRYDMKHMPATEMIKCVYDQANKESIKQAKSRNEKPQKIATRQIKALLKLSNEQGHGKFYTFKEIYEEAGLNPEKPQCSGLWMWDEIHGCGIVEKAEGVRQYRIKGEFLAPLQKVLEKA